MFTFEQTDITNTPIQSQTIESISTFPTCTEVFGNSSVSQQQTTNKLCDAPGAESLSEPVTAIRLSLKLGSYDPSDPDNSGSGSETLTFQGFPATDLTQQELNNFNPSEPCQYVNDGQPCQIFDSPTSISWKTYPVTQKYRLREITDSFPYVYNKYSTVVDYGEDDEGEDKESGNSGHKNTDFNTDPCSCSYNNNINDGGVLIDGGSVSKSNCALQKSLKIGGQHSTNSGHYLDDTCANGGTLGILANYTYNRLNDRHIGGLCTTSNDQCLSGDKTAMFICPGNSQAAFNSKKVTTPCQYCNINLGLVSDIDNSCKDISFDQIKRKAVWYNRGTIMACAGFLLNQDNTAATKAVELSEPCKSYMNKALGDRVTRNPSSFPLKGSYALNDPDGTTTDDSGICQVCIATYKSSSTIPGMWGDFRKCSFLIEDWREAFATLLSTNADQNKGVLFVDDKDESTTPDNQTFYYRSTQIYTNVGGTIKEQTKCCRFVLPATESQQILGRCTPTDSGDYCWGSYNEPTDFVQRTVSSASSGNPINGNFPNGYEDSGGSVNSDKKTITPKRGLAITPYFMDSIEQSNNGKDSLNNVNPVTASHLYRCGHYCSDFQKAPGTQSPNEDSEFNKGYVKGWFGLGPFCKAYEVDLFSEDFFAVDFIVNYNGNRSETIQLRSGTIGSSSVIGTTSGQTGVVARINSLKRIGGASTSTKLGGILVICGATVKASSSDSTGQISGKMGPNITVSVNPWNTLQSIQSNFQSGIRSSGSKSNGRPVPIPSFVTLLQCFSFETGCLAPRDVCEDAFDACRSIFNEGADGGSRCTIPFEYIDIGSDPPSAVSGCKTLTCGGYSLINPPKDGYIIRDIFNLDSDGKGECKCCSVSSAQAQQPQGQGWYWLPEQNRKAFGSECGQYGMSLNYGNDPTTAQYVCSSPGDSVRCAPGFDDISIGTKSPCEIIGGMTNYYGQTSCFTSSSTSYGSCYAKSDGKNNQGCNADVTDTVNLPDGLPPGWNPTIPNYWVDFFGGGGPALYFSPTDQSNWLADVELYVNGAALTTDTTNVSPGVILARPPGAIAPGEIIPSCTFTRGGLSSQSTLPFYVQNRGSLTSSYNVNFDGCSGIPAGSFTINKKSISVTNVAPGKTKPGIFQGSLDASVQLSAIQCTLTLTPQQFPSVNLSSVSIGCQITSGGKSTGSGSSGIDVDGSKTDVTPECASSAVWCFLENGGWEVQTVMYIVFVGFIILAAFGIYTVVKNSNREDAYARNRHKFESMKVQEAKLKRLQALESAKTIKTEVFDQPK